MPVIAPLCSWLRLLRCGLHLLWGAAVILASSPCSPARRLAIKGRWSRQLLGILGVQFDASLSAIPSGSLIVANHISWLDVFVLNAARPMAFVVKADVRGWPFIGWLVAHTDNVFLRRGSGSHARAVNHEIATRLIAGEIIAIFPEGTTSDGVEVLPFHSALLQPALDARSPVQPLALAYHDATGSRSQTPAYAGETSLWQSLRAIAAARGLKASITLLPPLSPGETKRRELAASAREAIAAALGVPPAISSTDYSSGN